MIKPRGGIFERPPAAKNDILAFNYLLPFANAKVFTFSAGQSSVAYINHN